MLLSDSLRGLTFDAATWKVNPEIGKGVLFDMRE
jgi:hypothetical protein